MAINELNKDNKNNTDDNRLKYVAFIKFTSEHLNADLLYNYFKNIINLRNLSNKKNNTNLIKNIDNKIDKNKINTADTVKPINFNSLVKIKLNRKSRFGHVHFKYEWMYKQFLRSRKIIVGGNEKNNVDRNGEGRGVVIFIEESNRSVKK